MTTKVVNQINKSYSNLEKGRAILAKFQDQRPEIVLLDAVRYPTYIEAYYLSDGRQVRARIDIRNIEAFINNDFNVPAVPAGSDMNISIYLDENLDDVTKAYIYLGKEIMPL